MKREMRDFSESPVPLFVRCIESVLTDNPGCGYEFVREFRVTSAQPNGNLSMGQINYNSIPCPKCGRPIALAANVWPLDIETTVSRMEKKP